MEDIRTYIGICDFMSREEVLDMLLFFEGLNAPKDVSLMVGTMTSYKVLNGLQTKYASVFPKPEGLHNVFGVGHESIVNCIHYADYDNMPDLAETLETLLYYCGRILLDAIQLDMVWPDPKELEKFCARHEPSLILQVSKRAMAECSDNPITVAKRIWEEYDGLISHVLLDCSMGKGVPINVSLIEGYIEAIKAGVPNVEITVAGGLGPGTVHVVKDLVEKYRVSIDAQGKLRKSGSNMVPIDWPLAKQYLKEAVSLY